MAGEIQTVNGTTGLTLYAIMRNSAGQAYNGATFEAYLTANLATYDIALTEQGTASRYYTGTFPVISAGVYSVTIYKQVAGAPSEANDKPVAHGVVFWNGTVLQSLNSVSVAELQVSALADMFNTNSATNYAASVTGSVVKETADNSAGASLTNASIADAVWDEDRTGHTTANTFGLFLDAQISAIATGVTVAAVADGVWDEARAGHVAVGSFGEHVLADLIEINGVTTPVTNIEAMYDGTGYVGGTIKLGTDVVKISGDATAADNHEAMLDGTGGVTLTTNITGAFTGSLSGSVGLISGITFPSNFGDLSITGTTGRVDVAAWLGTAVTIGGVSGLPDVNMEAINDDTTKAGFLDTMIGNGTLTATFTGNLTGSVASVTGSVGSVTGAVASVTAGVTLAANSMTAAASAADFLAEIRTQSDNALTSIGLDHLISAAVVGADVTDNSIFAKLVSKTAVTADWDTFNNTTDSLEALQSVGVTITGTPDVNVAQISGDAVAADKLETMLDGTGGNAFTATFTGNLTGSAASVTGAVGSVTGAVGSVTAGVTLTASGIDAIWDETQVGHVTAGSFGLYLDQAVSTATAPTAGAIADQVWDELRSAHTGAGSFGQGIASVQGDLTGNVDGNVGGNVTGSVGSISGVTFPTNFSDLSITVTSGRVDVQSWVGTTVTIGGTSGFPVVDAQAISDNGAAADNVQANIGNLDAAISSIVVPAASAIADAVWDETRTAHTTANTFGLFLDAQISGISTGITVAAIADGVWDEARAGHVAVGSFGEGVITESLNTQAKADVNAEVDTALTDYDAIVPADLPTNFSSLSINGSGRVDLGKWLGTAVTLSVGTLPAVDAQTISNSGAAADAVEANIGNLDVASSTLAVAATALSTSVWTAARGGYLDELNIGAATIAHTGNASSFMADVSALATAAALAIVDTNVDTLITNVPDVISLANINAQVDTALTDYDGLVAADLPANFSSLSIDANGRVVIQGTINDLDTLNDPTVAAITSGVWDALTSAHVVVGSMGEQVGLITAGSGTATLANQTKMLALVQGKIG